MELILDGTTVDRKMTQSLALGFSYISLHVKELEVWYEALDNQETKFPWWEVCGQGDIGSVVAFDKGTKDFAGRRVVCLLPRSHSGSCPNRGKHPIGSIVRASLPRTASADRFLKDEPGDLVAEAQTMP